MKEKIKIEKRAEFWKERNYIVAESGNGWKIMRPSEIKPLEEQLDKFFKRKRYKWE